MSDPPVDFPHLLHTCVLCGKKFMPKYPTKEQAFLLGDAEAREQWISPCCSTACWDANMSFDDDDEE